MNESVKKRVTAGALSTNTHLLRWVEKMADLCQPAAIHWVDGSQEEYDALCAADGRGGDVHQAEPRAVAGLLPGALRTPSDVARVEDRTFICSLSKEAAGPTNNWVESVRDAEDAEAGSSTAAWRAGRCTCWPFSMGPIGSPMSQIGVQLTDSPYAVVNMRIMARIGKKVFQLIDQRLQARRAVRALGGRAAGEGTEGRPVAVQQGEVHRPFSRDARDLELRLRLRRQRAARARSVSRCASRRRWRATKAGWPSTC